MRLGIAQVARPLPRVRRVEQLRGRSPRTPAGFRQEALSVPTSVAAEESGARAATGMPGLDRVLGGGLVAGSVVLLGGEPGIGKSTLLLQAARCLAAGNGEVLYATAEESAAQVRMRAERLGIREETLLLTAETDVTRIVAGPRRRSPALLIVDSIQAVRAPALSSAAGTVSQVRECASSLQRYAKSRGVPVILIGHVTKDGSLAGPKSLEHLVDTVVDARRGAHLAAAPPARDEEPLRTRGRAGPVRHDRRGADRNLQPLGGAAGRTAARPSRQRGDRHARRLAVPARRDPGPRRPRHGRLAARAWRSAWTGKAGARFSPCSREPACRSPRGKSSSPAPAGSRRPSRPRISRSWPPLVSSARGRPIPETSSASARSGSSAKSGACPPPAHG